MADQLQFARITPVALPYLSRTITAGCRREREAEIQTPYGTIQALG